MALSKPNRRYSKVMIRHRWGDIPPSLFGDLAAAAREEHENAQAAAGSVRRAIAEVESEEKGTFATASVHAYKQELALWNELAEGCAKEAPAIFQAGSIQTSKQLEIMRIDEEAHEAIAAAEAEFAHDPIALGNAIKTIVTTAGLEIAAVDEKASAEISALTAAAPVWTGAASHNGSGGSAPHGGNAVRPVDSVTEKGGGVRRDHRPMSPPSEADSGRESASESDSAKNGHRSTSQGESSGRTDQSQADASTPESSAAHRATSGTPGVADPGVGSAAGRGLSASPMAGGMSPSAGSGGGSSMSGGLSSGVKPPNSLGGLGSGSSAPRMGAVPPAAPGGPVQDFAKGFTSAASAPAPAPAVVRPLAPAEGVRPPMSPTPLGAAGAAPGAPPAAVASSSAGAQPVPVAPVSPGPSASPTAGGGPLPPFGSDLRASGSGSATSAAPSPGVPTAPAAPPNPGGGTGASGALLSGSGAAGTAVERAAEQAGWPDFSAARMLVWELLHACRQEWWHVDFAVGLFEMPYGGVGTLVVSNEGWGCLPPPVVPPRPLVPALTDPALPPDFLSRWFGWIDVTRVMIEYSDARVAAGKSALLGVATSGSTTAAERREIPVCWVDRDASPFAWNADDPGLTFDRYHRVNSLEPGAYERLSAAKDRPQAVIDDLVCRARRLLPLTEGSELPTCGHDVLANVASRQRVSETLADEVRREHRRRQQLASTNRTGAGEYGPPGEVEVMMQEMYRPIWISAQILEVAAHLSGQEPNLPDATYAVAAAERISGL
ncbi:putative methyl-accepting chemotaxis sensory transducer [Mycobacteroides abscessus subsp. abscessus]|nr:putative methyl-accepting chemotaxis sensory transducer [Mycobacteroides abscessus subsp. abscessus]